MYVYLYLPNVMVALKQRQDSDVSARGVRFLLLLLPKLRGWMWRRHKKRAGGGPKTIFLHLEGPLPGVAHHQKKAPGVSERGAKKAQNKPDHPQRAAWGWGKKGRR